MKFKSNFSTETRKIYLFLVIFLSFIGFSMITMFYTSDLETNQDFFSDINNSKSSYEVSLDYNDWRGVYATSGPENRLH